MKRGALLLIAVLVLAGGVGWYVWDQNKNDTKAQNSTQTTSPTTQTQNNLATYLKIPEKGVKFELTPKINDAYYFVNPEGYTYISLHRFDKVTSAKGCTAAGNFGNGGGIEILKAVKPGDENAGSIWTQQQLEAEPNAKLINNTYYWLEPTHAACTSNDDTESTMIENEIGSIRGEFVKIQNTISQM
jgi:hypothetical protein